jgi:thiamine phosphate synthase YjbQ (UPF0047 family)
MTVAALPEITLELVPRARYDVIDIARRLRDEHGDVLGRYPKVCYCSHHTTAGYLEQSLGSRLGRSGGVDPYIQVFQTLFPPEADYHHDRLHLREELSETQRRCEPRNADSHLAFISSGLRSCVTYVNRPGTAVYFIDLDGVNHGTTRRRQTTVLPFRRERLVERVALEVPVSGHPIDSINLRDPRTGLYEALDELIRRRGVAKGRVDLWLPVGERSAGLTVNEYETLLMRHDLAEVLRDPLRFVVEKWRHMVADPRAIPDKAIEYAKYDLVRVSNTLMDKLGVSESMLERIVARFLALPAARFLRMKRSVSLLVSDRSGTGAIVQGPYQSPILVQWKKAPRQARRLEVAITEFS